MERRNFIKVMAGAFGALSVRNSLGQAPPRGSAAGGKILKGFIVSDAHYGMQMPVQPNPTQQVKVMQTIMARFPDLDVFLDTGDAFHSSLPGAIGDLAKTNWTDTVPNGCKTVPFYYVPGNHDLAFNGPQDSEWRDDNFGSMPCRPYFSFDVKGVHFVSVPQLEDAVFINKETLEWLKLDLALNKDRTVILLAHNNIKGTTTLFGEEGYRGLINGDEMVALFAKYPNIISWMHGHNHTYEVVPKNNMVFVSNGRFGGFIPPPSWGVGQEQLGGIYFEVHPDKFVVRCYSGDQDKFFDEQGHAQLSTELPTTTTVSETPGFAFSYGAGGMCDGQRIPAFNHYGTASGKSELFVTGAEAPEINDDPTFVNYTLRNVGKLGNRWTLFSASVGYPKQFEPENTLWSWENPGFKLLAQPAPQKTVDVCLPDYEIGKYEYYRCAPGNTHQATLEIESPSGGQTLDLAFIYSDKNGKALATVTVPTIDIKAGKQTYDGQGKMPPVEGHQSIYTDPLNDNEIQLTVRARFSKLTEAVMVHRISMTVAGAGAHTTDPEILLNGQSFAHPGTVLAGDLVRFDIPSPSSAREIYECKVAGSRRVAWLVRHRGLDWQVRNAAVADHGTYLETGPLRNTWGSNQEVVISSLTGTSEPYVHRMQNIQSARIYPLNRKNATLKAEVLECSDPALLIISASQKPQQVLGATKWNFADSLVTIEVTKGAQIEIS